MGEIDSRLIEARTREEPVLVYVSPTVYYRGVPGQVYRKRGGPLLLRLGVRDVPLMKVTKVVVG